MEIKNNVCKKEKKFSSLNFINPIGCYQKNIDNTLYDENKSKKLKLKVIKGVGGALILCGVALGLASTTFPGESIKVQKKHSAEGLSKIAEEYGIDQSKLEKRNKLENPDYIQIGQDLIRYKRGPVGFFPKNI